MSHNSAEIQTIRGDDADSSDAKPLVVGFTILFHPNPSRIGEVAPMVELGSNARFQLSRLEPSFQTPFEKRTGPLNTPFVSRTPIELHAEADRSVMLTRKETADLTVDALPSQLAHRFDEAALQRGVVLLMGDAVVVLLHLFDPNVMPHLDDLGMIGHNTKMERLRSEILKVADLETGVLIRGESGTGKELVALAIQTHSRRADAPFEKVNVTEIPTAIAERELFGAAKHAGTMEPGHDGYFVRANRGTLFLDEIGDIDPAVQPKLLRAVETGEIQILGAKKKTKVDVRLLAGTDVDLEHAVETGQFKSSLLERLAAYPIYIPPLRERRDDIGRLFFYFLKNALRATDELYKLDEPESSRRPWFPASLVAKLTLYSWPGNVRQLRNAATRIAIINRENQVFQLDDRIGHMLAAGVVDSRSQEASTVGDDRLDRRALEALTDNEVIRALEENGFNISRAVRALNVERAMFYRDIKRRGFNVEVLREDWTTRRI